MEPRWKHDEVFPHIASAIDAINAQHSGYAAHDEIVKQFLRDPQARRYVEAAQDSSTADTPEHIAANMIAWFSQRITAGASPWVDRFNRRQIGGKWAYRVVRDDEQPA